MSAPDPFSEWLQLHAALIAKEKELAELSARYSAGFVESSTLGDFGDEVRRLRAASDAALAAAITHMRAQRRDAGGP